MLEYELNGKIYTEEDLIKAAGGKDKLPAYIKNKGFKPASKKTKQPAKLDERFGEDIYKKTFGFENPAKDQFSEINKTKKKKPIAKNWNEVITAEDLRGEESTVSENLNKKLSRYGLTPEEATFGFNRITIRGDKKQPLYSTINNAGVETATDLPEVAVGADLSKEELAASAKQLNEYIKLHGNKDYIQKVKNENPNLVRTVEQKIQAPSRTFEEKLKVYNEEQINQFENKEEIVKNRLRDSGVPLTKSRKKYIEAVKPTKKDFSTPDEYNAYEAWKKTGQLPLPSTEKLEKFIGEYNNNYRAKKSSEVMSSAPQDQRTMLQALETDREDKSIQKTENLRIQSAELDKKNKAFSEKTTKFEKIPPTPQEFEEYKKEYFALQNESAAYNKEILNVKKDFNNIKAVSEAASKDYSRLNQTGSLLKQTALGLAGGTGDILATGIAATAALTSPATYKGTKTMLKEVLLDPIYSEQKAVGKELESYQRDLQIKDVKSMKDLGRWGAGVLTQMPSSMAMAVTGEVAMPLFFLSGYGSKQYEIASSQDAALSRLKYNTEQIDKGLVAAEDMADVQKQVASDKKTLNISEGVKLTSELLAGTAEVLFEKYGTLGIIKETDNILRSIPPQEIKRQLKVIGKEMGKSAGVEAWTEGLTQFANNVGDIYLLGQDKNFFDGVPDSMAGGAFMGPGFAAMGGAGTVSNNITKAVISELTSKEEFKARNRKLDEIKKLTGLEDVTGLTKTQLNKLTLQPPVKKAVEELIDQIDGEDLRVLDRLGKDFSMEDAKKVGDLNQKLRKITKDWNEASRTGGIDEAQLKSLKDYYQKQYNDVFNEREVMLTDKQLAGKNKKENAQKRITFEATEGYNRYDYRLTKKVFEERRINFSKLSSEDKQKYNDSALAQLTIEKPGVELTNKQIEQRASFLYAGEEISKKLDRDIDAAREFAKEAGFNTKIEVIENEEQLKQKFPNLNEEDLTGFIGKEATEDSDAIEGTNNGFYDDKSDTIIIYRPNAIKTGHASVGSHEMLHALLFRSFKGVGKDANASGLKLLDYLKTAQPALHAIVEQRLEKYNPETYDAYGEEVFNALSDAFKDGKVPNDNVLTQISKTVNKITKGKYGLPEKSTSDILNINSADGKTMYELIKGYNSKTTAQNDKKNKGLRPIGVYDDENPLPISATTSDKNKLSKARIIEVKKKIDNLEEQFDKGDVDYDDYTSRLEAFEIELEKAKKAPEETAKPEVKKVEITEEDADKEIIKNEKGTISSDKVQKIYEEKGLNGAQDIINLFKPITRRLVNRRRDAPGFDEELLRSEIETGDGGILYLIRSYKPEKGVPLAAYINKQLPLRAIAASRRVLDKDFSKDVTEEKGLIAEETVSEAKEKPKYNNALEAKVFTPEILKTATGKIVTIIRTLKNRIDAPVTLNRTVTPLISEIRDEVGKQLDIDIKTMLGGKKDGVLVKELLRNKKYILENMTTTWLMGKDGQGGIPQAIQKQIDGKWVSFPDWVGQKIDREKTTTDQAGRTSGAELVRRLPNVNNNVSNEEFLAQIVGPDGNPIRGRKESLSKAMAEEGAFDIINADFAEEGPIFEAFTTNQERLGYEIVSNMAVDFARQADRGNVKLAKTNVIAVDKIGTEFFDFYAKSNLTTRTLIFKYLDDREFKGINDDTKNKLNDILLRWENAYNDNSDKILNKINIRRRRQQKEEYPTIESFNKYFAKEKEDLRGSKTVLIEGLTKSGLNFVENNREAINEIGNYVFFNLKSQIDKAKNENEKIDFINSFLRTYRAVFTGGEFGKFFTIGNTDLLNKLKKEIKGFDDLGYKIKIIGSNSVIVDKNGINPTFVEEQSTKKGDIKNIIENGIDKLNTNREEQVKTARTDVLNFADFIKGSSMSPKAKAMAIILMRSSTFSPLRTMAKVDSIILDKNNNNPEGYTWEHVIPADEIVRNIMSYALEIPFADKPIPTRENLITLFEESRISLLPKNINNILNTIFKNQMGSNWKIGDDPYNARYFNKNILEVLKANNIDLRPSDLTKLSGEGNTIKKIDFEARKNDLNNINKQEAVLLSLSPEKLSKAKGISVFDFDDTVGLTKGNVLYMMPDGSTGKLNAEEFAKEGSNLLSEGAVFDFSEFSKVVDGKPGPMVEKMKKMIGKFGPDNFFILTARPPDAAVPIHEFLSSIGIDIPLENITGLGNSTAQAKADWMVAKAAEGYNDFYFSDDAIQNVTAVENALKVLDVKSKIQQAKLKLSQSMSIDFNRIIEENKGVESYKVFSDITARRRGLKKNQFDFYVPPSAADFELLLYKFMGKGTLGEEQKKFFQDALINPYINGVDMMDAVRQSIKKEYKALLKSFPEIKKELEKLTPNKNFTYDQAMRVAIWNQYGTEIPGLSQRDTTYLTDLINSDPDLAAFKDGLIVMGRQKDGWLPPSTYWDSDTIVSDLYNITEGSGRKKFLGEFIENTENIFGKFEDGRLSGPNINKVEAVYGTNVREALEDSIYRMINGKNRSIGQDKETTAWSSWVNGSTGAIMFMNTRSAALQMLGAVNFLNWRDNNPYNAGKAFLDQPQYWKDFSRIWNSDKLKERRGGLREDVASAEIANAAAGSKNKVVAVTSYLLKIGYTPTQLADSFAIASGGAPFYRNRINSYLKEGLTEQEAESKAWKDFSKISDETQQSGDPKDISKQQSSAAGRILLVFQNFTMQQSRIVKKAVLDLKNGRGDAKTNISKIAYYLAVQNIMFSTLQQGLFAVMFDDDDEDKDKKKKTKKDAAIDVANGVLDSILRGTGFIGGVAATLKNTVVKYFEEQAKKQKAEYAKVVLEAANMSPPIGSKLRKTYSALQQTKYDKDLIAARGWGVMQDGRVHLGPMYSVTGKLVEVGTNFPMDRLVNKVENVSQAFNSENTAMQRLATGMGYSPWTVGIEGTKGDILIKETAKAKRKEEGLIKAKETRKENAQKLKDSIRSLSIPERRAYRLKIVLEKREKRKEKALKKREERRKKLEMFRKLNANK